MTILYKPVLIVTEEQAEALPRGTQRLQDGREGLALGWTALVPIEVEEETSVVDSAPGSRDIDAHPYSEVNMDSDGNVWFDEGLNRVDVTEQFIAWAKEETYSIQTRGQTAPEWRTRLVTPWEEVSDRP